MEAKTGITSTTLRASTKQKKNCKKLSPISKNPNASPRSGRAHPKGVLLVVGSPGTGKIC
jgi:ATP-dependent 26S proteasome regulatory subunit